MPQLPALGFNPQNALIDTSGMGNALNDFARNRLMQRESDRQDEELALRKQQSARIERSSGLEDEARIARHYGGLAQLVDQEQDPTKRAQMWTRIVQSRPEFAGSLEQYGVDPNDAVNGPKFIIAQARGYQDPIEAEKQRLQLEDARLSVQKAQRDLAQPNTKLMQIGDRLVEVGPDNSTREIYAAPPKQDPLDTFYGKEQARADFKTIGDYRTAADGAGELRGNLDALRKARSETNTEGPIMGLLPAITSGQQAVDSTAENVRLGFIGKTKGAVSDAEMRIFGMATPGRRMRDDAAKTIIDGMDLAAQRTQEQAVFFDEWMRQNGNLNGAQTAWQSYIDRNPIIKETKPGVYTLNRENVGNWRQFFAGQGRQAQQPGMPAQQAAPQTPAPQGGMASPRSKQEYDALPSGTPYTAPDGSVRVKP